MQPIKVVKLNDFNPKITAKQLVINILRTFRPSTGAIFNANNVPQTGTSNGSNGSNWHLKYLKWHQLRAETFAVCL